MTLTASDRAVLQVILCTDGILSDEELENLTGKNALHYISLVVNVLSFRAAPPRSHVPAFDASQGLPSSCELTELELAAAG
jgi:hypothetical protein